MDEEIRQRMEVLEVMADDENEYVGLQKTKPSGGNDHSVR